MYRKISKHHFIHSFTHSFFLFIDTKSWTALLPSFEFMNFVVALIVWSSRYPSVFWSTSKSFSLVFSIQMIANAIDLLLVFAGVSVVYKLQIVGQKLPLQVSWRVLCIFENFEIFFMLILLCTIPHTDSAIVVEWNRIVAFVYFINTFDNCIIVNTVFVWAWTFIITCSGSSYDFNENWWYLGLFCTLCIALFYFSIGCC